MSMNGQNHHDDQLPEGVVIFHDQENFLDPIPKDYMKIDYLDFRKDIFQEGDTVPINTAKDLIRKGLAKFRIIPKVSKDKELVKCRILAKGVKSHYANGVCHYERQKAEDLQDQGIVKIIEGISEE